MTVTAAAIYLLVLVSVVLGGIEHVKYVTKITPPPTLSPAQRAQALLAQMNITEKINMVHGWPTPYVGGVPENTRLGIPALNLNDGPQVC